MQFIETPLFTQRIKDILSDEEYRLLQSALTDDPEVGALISGGKGLRKMRWSSDGKGKRGGVRIIYYLYPREEKFFMLFIYKKSGQEDLTAGQIKILIDYVKEGVL